MRRENKRPEGEETRKSARNEGNNMVSKNALMMKVSRNESLSRDETKTLLESRNEEHIVFGIKSVRNSEYKELLCSLANLLEDKRELVVSDALECMAELDPKTALKFARRMIGAKNRYVQSSSLYVVGEYGVPSDFDTLSKESIKFQGNPWRMLNFYEALYKLDSQRSDLIDSIGQILLRTRDYRTQCAALNSLDRIRNRKNSRKIIMLYKEFAQRELSVAARSTLNQVYE